MINENDLEQNCIDWFKELGWDYYCGYDIAPNSDNPKRSDYKEVVLTDKLKEALFKINPNIPKEKIIDEVIPKLLRFDSPILEVNNRQFHKFINDEILIELRVDGRSQSDFVKIIDFKNIENNNFVIVNQFTITGNNGNRRPDIIAFINGLPIAVIELKNTSDEDDDIIWKAFEQINTYKQELPDLFNYNLACIISDGVNARIGSITAGKERFGYWRTIREEKEKPNFKFELETMIKGFFIKELLIDYLRYFVIFEENAGNIIKKIAGYHQFHAVRKAVKSTIIATNDIKDGKCGVVWHTQGSGKSISMCCYVAKLMTHTKMRNPTIVVVTDRNDLDGQLYQTFCHSKELLKEEPKQADSRDELRALLKRPSGGIIFTTIQKFSLLENENIYPTLSDRNNIVVISDEAHRTQYGFKSKFRKSDGKLVSGFARYMRDALPNAGFIGFTGTPISLEDRDTVNVFGDYISIYDIKQANKDEATVPIHYDHRFADLEIKVDEANLDEEVDSILQSSKDYTESYADQQKKKWTTLEKLVTAKPRIKKIANHLVEHFEDRLKVLHGKGMIVCISRMACVKMYDELTALRPNWYGTSGDNGKPSYDDGEIRVIMTGSASDKEELRKHIYDKKEKKELEKRFKNPDDKLKLVIVCDMWLTGFDVPSLHTMYIDKPIKGHNLMQAIARVNRVFKNKPGGLIVDYLGITNDLKEALNTYTNSKGEGIPAIDIYQALTTFLGKMAQARYLLQDVDYSDFKDDKKIFSLITECCEHLYRYEELVKTFCNSVLASTKANAICGTMEEAKEHRDELAFFQAIKSALTKKEKAPKAISNEQVQGALRQIVSKSLVSDKIVDIFEVAGLKKPDISILSGNFLEEVKSLEHKNIAIELLNRLLKDEIKIREKTNLVLAKKYSELLEETLLKYKHRSIHTAQVIEELVKMANDFKKSIKRGEDLGLNESEFAFYNALADNKSAVTELGDKILKKIAIELTKTLRNSITVDWAKRESVRSTIKLRIKKLLEKYKYPPDNRKEAVQLVLSQAETISESWTT